MKRFVVTAGLRTPLVRSAGYLTLDALLAAILFDKLQDVEAAHSAVPLRCSDGLFHASAAVLEPVDKSRIVAATHGTGFGPKSPIQVDVRADCP